MRAITTREFRNTPGKLRELLAEGEVVLTANNEPIAVLVPAGEDFEDTVDLLRQIRLQRAIREMRCDAKRSGTDELSPEEIAEEIRQTRAGRP